MKLQLFLLTLTLAVLNILLSHQASGAVNAQTSKIHEVNDVLSVDVLKRDNCNLHKTCNYKQMFSSISTRNPGYNSIVLRRGFAFNITLRLKLPLDLARDKLRLEFQTGPQPQLKHGTLIYVPIALNKEFVSQYDWSAFISKYAIKSKNAHNQLTLTIATPADAPIGVWSMKITARQDENESYPTLVRSFQIPQQIYLIFNPWANDDDTYMSGDSLRNEHLLNEVGKIYIGTYARPTGRKWTFGQFAESVLPTIMLLLDNSRLTIEDRSNVVKVSRAISAIVNSHDEAGILVGNWSGHYGDGMAPWKWTSSVPIIDQYLNTSRPVKFAQCWVFAGVTTTALKTIGIPARTVSNFASAHDTDDSLTIDKFFSETDQELNNVNTDSIWNFHVWSDAWMARRDLPPGFGGWQTIDATPQETSMGKYQVGPASVEAVKQGKVDYAYDTGFVFSEVNADVVHWKLDKSQTQWKKVKVLKNAVGKSIFTKSVGKLDDYSFYKTSDAQDIVLHYKFREGSAEERAAYSSAARAGGLSFLLEQQ